ncbi:MAG: putative nucleic-acid-binding protein, contains PIN domain [Microgenomates group bacterium Gr01-1014_7]|nr:MAG: putative nucleic-acid-binding protein, contains PIN domain [Microgenomates group bacterium Gr01-1014_7]
MKLLDANLILRFLLKDDVKQFQKAKSILENSEENLYLSDMIIAEVVWVLISFYKFNREDIIEKIYNLLNLNSIYSNKSLFIRTLYFYRNFNIDFIDAYLAAYCESEKLEAIYSFDKGLDKIKEIKRFKP